MATYPVSVAHAALRFIAAKGLHDEFFASGALTGHLCDTHCGHAPIINITQPSVTETSVTDPERTLA